MYYGAAISEGPGVRGKDVFVVGGGNSAGQAAMNFAEVARSVTLLVRGQGLAGSMSRYLSRRLQAAPNIVIHTRAELVAVDGDDWLRTLIIRDRATGELRDTDAHALFICIGGVPHTRWLREAHVLTDAAGYIVTGRDLLEVDDDGAGPGWAATRDPYPLESSQPGVFAAGDVRRGSTKRVSAAVGEGAMAVGLIHRYLAEVGNEP